ncbi:FAD:protein FMN transferase [Glaciecola siphonariae]|uniref:FAD:protein FMN transferase n=1 Tax=Glaciecola siphonariae TaxID=521012 RepID=A0ABV9LSF8_9ALTE
MHIHSRTNPSNLSLVWPLLALLVLAITSHTVKAKWQERSEGIMGTNIRAEVFHQNDELRQRALSQVMIEMERINQLMSPYIDSSELSLLNRTASLAPVKVSDEMFYVLGLSAQLSELTLGAFDITFASVGYLYDYRQKRRPEDAQIGSLLSAINYRHVELNEANQTVFFAHPDVKIDLGGIAKGYAVDKAIEALEAMGIKHALVTAGGDTRLLGDRLGKPWVVGIRDPRDKSKQAVLIPLEDAAMSTSGDYERYFEEDGKRFHHILSPKTGKSSYHVQSVSVIGPESVYNDALSTAVFVMGVEEGLGLINALPDFEAIVMDNQRRMHYSKGLEQ